MTTREYNKAVEEYSGRLLRFAKKLLQDEPLAEDVVQECFLKLWEHSSKIDPEKAKSWLFTTGYRQCLHVIGLQKRKAFHMPDFAIEPTTAPDLKEVLENCMATLPEIQRSVLMLRDYEGYEYKEIGQILTLNESQVKVYLFRARTKMKELIKDLNLVL